MAMAEPLRFRHGPVIGLILLLAATAGVSFTRAVQPRFDFKHFYLDLRYVWEHGVLNPVEDDPDPDRERQLPFYLPSVPLLLSPIAAFGLVSAAAVWTVAQVVSLGLTLWLLRAWVRERPGLADPVLCLALGCVLALPALYEAAKFNQVSFVVLVLVVGGVRSLERGRLTRSGLLFGAAVTLKLLPAVFIAWLVLKREWRALLAALGTTAGLAVLPCLIAFGSDRTLTYYRDWWRHNVEGPPSTGWIAKDLREHFIDRRNQSIGAVLARLTQPDHRFADPWQPVELSPRRCRQLALTLTGVLGVALLWFTRRPARQLSEAKLRCEAAVYALAMLVFSPLLRQYYLVWALPALVLLVYFATDPIPLHRQRLAQVGLLLWLLGMAAWLSKIARSYGAHLVLLIALGVLVLLCGWATRRCSPASRNGEVGATATGPQA